MATRQQLLWRGLCTLWRCPFECGSRALPFVRLLLVTLCSAAAGLALGENSYAGDFSPAGAGSLVTNSLVPGERNSGSRAVPLYGLVGGPTNCAAPRTGAFVRLPPLSKPSFRGRSLPEESLFGSIVGLPLNSGALTFLSASQYLCYKRGLINPPPQIATVLALSERGRERPAPRILHSSSHALVASPLRVW